MPEDETINPLESPEVDPTKEPNSDPLDEITDEDTLRNIIIKTSSFDVKNLATLSGKSVDELRAEAKKFRSISQRKKPEQPRTEVQPEIPTDVVRKSDLAKVATSQAKKMLPAEVLEVYDELVKIPLAGFDSLDSESIASNLKERYNIYRTRNPKQDGKPDTTHLQTTTAPKGTGGDAPKEKVIGGNISRKPDSWYPKKEA